MVALAFFSTAFRPWLQGVLYGKPVSIVDIFAMRLRGNPPALLVNAYIALHQARVTVTIREVENAYVDARSRIATTDDLVQVVKARSEPSI